MQNDSISADRPSAPSTPSPRAMNIPASQHAPHHQAGLFGTDTPAQQAALHVFSQPWDATASYGLGAALTPTRIIQASHQLDLMDPHFGHGIEAGVHMFAPKTSIIEDNHKARKLAQESRSIGSDADRRNALCAQVDALADRARQDLLQRIEVSLDQGKKVGLLGGDHSVSLPLIKALAKRHASFGILHFDAHLDLRQAYEGFTSSHASIMSEVLHQCSQVSQLCSVGIRDYCAEERDFAASQGERVRVFWDSHLFDDKAQGKSWKSICDGIIDGLPEHVYVSFDIDGFDPALCPSTGTPVPGGLSFMEASYLLKALATSKRKVIGFDLVEVAPHPTDPDQEWDLNVGARLLYKLCCLLLRKN